MTFAVLAQGLPRFREARAALPTLAANETRPRAAIETDQLERVNAIWTRASRHSPYYVRLRNEHGLPPHFDSLEEYSERVPVLPKEIVRQFRNDFLSDKPAPGDWARTGGSTGAPMSVYWSEEARRRDLQSAYRWEQSWGLDLFDRKAFLWGHAASFAAGVRGRLQRQRLHAEDRLRNRLRLSAYRLGERDLDEYLQQLQEFKPLSLYGYSSAAALLADRARAQGVTLPSLRVVLLTGEPAPRSLRSAVEAALGAPTAVEYGSVECGNMAFDAPDGTLRVREDTHLLETLARPDGRFEIVVTVLTNPSFPLLRYAIEDVVDEPLVRPPQGFAILGEVRGRSNDHLVARSGRLVHSLAVKHVFELCPGVRRFQAKQAKDGSLEVLVERSGELPLSGLERTKKQLEDLVEGFSVRVEAIDRLPPSPSGKHRWVVSARAEDQQ